MRGIRRLFVPRVGLRGPVAHLFSQFQDSLADQRKEHEQSNEEQRKSRDSRLSSIVADARERGVLLPEDAESLGAILVDLLSKESCAEWLGYEDVVRDDLPRSRPLAAFVREPDWGREENVEKLRLYRGAAFIDLLRPGLLDWQTPRISDMEWASKLVATFSQPGLQPSEQRDIIYDLFNVKVELKQIAQPTRSPRLRVSGEDLRYVWETRELSHRQRAEAWDSRTPKPFRPFGRSNVEMYEEPQLRARWRTAVNRLRNKAKAAFDLEDLPKRT